MFPQFAGFEEPPLYFVATRIPSELFKPHRMNERVALRARQSAERQLSFAAGAVGDE
jgi:hypothetical protein